MSVAIDEARHQNSAAAIDDASVGSERTLGRLDRLDPFALDDNPQALDERVRLAVEEPEVGERDARNGGRRRGRGHASRSRGERPGRSADGDVGRIAGEFLRQMRVQPCKNRRVAEASCRTRSLPIIRRAVKHRLPQLTIALLWAPREAMSDWRPRAIGRRGRVRSSGRRRVRADQFLALELSPKVGRNRMLEG